MAKLRFFQKQLVEMIYSAWEKGFKNVMAVAPTGAGKTVIASEIFKNHTGPCIAIAHRQELVSQISLAFARNEIVHRIVGPASLVKICRQIQLLELNCHYIDQKSRVGVAGVDTLIRIKNDDPYYKQWFNSITLQMQDEAHHVLKNNKWGEAASKFANAKGLFLTATPIRADGKGLGRHVDGLMDTLVEAPSLREIINLGYLTDYRIISPPVKVDLSRVEIGANGEFKHKQLADAVKKSYMVGDVVSQYLRFAKDKLGVTFATNIEEAVKITKDFNLSGVPAEIVSAKTSPIARSEVLKRFKDREVMQLVNVDLFGEGFDLPAIEVVSFARPTASYSLYCQQFGRALRLMLDQSVLNDWDSFNTGSKLEFIKTSKKPKALILDHVDNVLRHGLPDYKREWSLDRREKRSTNAKNEIPLKVCPECLQPYEKTHKVCPYCGQYTPPTIRSGPAFVDGDLTELSADILAKMRGEIERIDGPPRIPEHSDRIVTLAIMKNHRARQEGQKLLRESMAWYKGLLITCGMLEEEAQYKQFYFTFGIDVASAQVLNKKDAMDLREKIIKECMKHNIDASASIGGLNQ